MYLTNAEFGIENPFAPEVPDLTQIEIDANDVGSPFRFGTPGDGTRVFDRQTTFVFGDTFSFTRGGHSFRVGGEFRRHHLDGDLQETRNRRHNFDDWHDFLTVGYRDPADDDRARQISDSALSYGETLRSYRMTDWSWFVADDWRVSSRLTLNVGLRHDYFGFPSEKNGLFTIFDYPAALASGNIQDGFIFPSNFDPASFPGAAGLDLRIADTRRSCPATTTISCRGLASRGPLSRSGTSWFGADTVFSSSALRPASRTRCASHRRSFARHSSIIWTTGIQSHPTFHPSRFPT